MWYIIIAIVVILALAGVIHFIRRQIAVSRAQLKDVDRSKLNDLDHDAWSDEDDYDNS